MLSYSCRASAQRVNLALLGALSVKYLSGLWSTKIVIWDPNTMSLKRLNAQITAYASRSIAAHAHWVGVSFWLAKAIGCSWPVLSHWLSWHPTEIALASVCNWNGWPGVGVAKTGASHTFCRKVSKACCSFSPQFRTDGSRLPSGKSGPKDQVALQWLHYYYTSLSYWCMAARSIEIVNIIPNNECRRRNLKFKNKQLGLLPSLLFLVEPWVVDLF